jgi:hypothetical protein
MRNYLLAAGGDFVDGTEAFDRLVKRFNSRRKLGPPSPHNVMTVEIDRL